MADPYRDESSSEPSEADIRDAVRAWGRGVVGGPRRLDDQITAIEACDDYVVRVATEIRRRDLVERRRAAPPPSGHSRRSVDVRKVDPFAGSMHDLRGATEHSAQCRACAGDGLATCPNCRGTGRAACGACGGAGRSYARSKRGAACKPCHETGKVHCARCDGTAKVTCEGCDGTGAQLVWFEYAESVRTVIVFDRKSPILLAHRHLSEQRFLEPRDLERFTPFVTVQETGPLAPGSLEPADADVLARIAPAVDAQLERVTAQQFLSFGVVRRDVRYEMSGMAGVLPLSGANLLGASTPAALGPIRRRLMLLGGVAVALFVLANSWRAGFGGPTTYFAAVNTRVTLLTLAGVLGGLVAAAGALRRLRPGFKWWTSHRGEHVAAGIFVASLVAAPLVSYLGRPTVPEAHAAIAAGDLERAAVVVEALKATRPSAAVTDVDDELTLTLADRLTGDARIAKLDESAAHPGPRADEARERARQVRLEIVTAALRARQPAEALSRLDGWTSELKTSPEVPELRAQAYDQKASACSDNACRFLAARSAHEAHASPTRSQALAAARQNVLAGLEPKEASAPDALTRVRALRAASALGATVLAASPDAPLSEKATAAVAAVGAELDKVTLLGAPTALVNEVLDRPSAGSPLTGWRELAGVAVYPAEVAGHCTGLYVIGASKDARSLSGREPGLLRLLTRATGRPASGIKARPKSQKEQETSKWAEGTTQVLARWNGEALMELRIGDATP